MKKIKHRKYYADKYESNVNYQINNLNKAIYRYGGSVNNKAKAYRYVSGIKKLGIMQPRTLKVVGDIITEHLSAKVTTNSEDKYCMFTLVTGFNFGKDNWNMHYQKLIKQTRELLKGYDYIATIALDEFPKARYADEGLLMSWHVHGIFFKEPTRWFISDINKKIEAKGYKITPLKKRHFVRLIDAVYYAFKSPFGGKVRYINKYGEKKSKSISLYLNALYQNFQHLKSIKRSEWMFAGGKGQKVLNDILEDMNNVTVK